MSFNFWVIMAHNHENIKIKMVLELINLSSLHNEQQLESNASTQRLLRKRKRCVPKHP